MEKDKLETAREFHPLSCFRNTKASAIFSDLRSDKTKRGQKFHEECLICYQTACVI